MNNYILSAKVLTMLEQHKLVHDTNWLGLKKNFRIEVFECSEWILKSFLLSGEELKNPLINGLFEIENLETSCKLMFNTGKDNVKDIQLEPWQDGTSFIKTKSNG